MTRWHTQDESENIAVPKRFVARQPILDRSRSTYGYELLFREGWENRFSGDPEASSRTIIDNSLVYGMESLVGAAVPFINCTHELIVQDTVSLLPRGSVIEVLEDVTVDDTLVAACKRLRAQGYRIALDDFDFDPRWTPLLPLADFIKVDFLASTSAQRVALLKKLSARPTLFVAEKIEDEKDFQIALKEGFHLFQGYFFARPVVVARPAIGTLATRFRLMQAMREPELHTDRILKMLKQEPPLAVRLLRLSNSAAVAARDRISDVRTALAMVGQQRFRQLALATVLSEITTCGAREFQKSILQRSRFFEGMAGFMQRDPDQMFFFGVFSLLQPALQLSRDEICHTVALDAALLDALFGQANQCRLLLDAFVHFERGTWDRLTHEADDLGVAESEIAQRFYLAQHWANGILDTAVRAEAA